MNQPPTLLTDFLKQLHVPFTYSYSAKRLAGMPFQSLFGLKKLLEEYGISCQGYHLADNKQLLELPLPYLAATRGGIVIVTGYDKDSRTLTYMSQGIREEINASQFMEDASGDVFIALPKPTACEPDYARHRRMLFFASLKKWVLRMCLLFLFVYLWISRGLYQHPGMYFIALLDMVGLAASVMLLQKTLRIHNPAADKVCKVIEDGGCDNVLKTQASTFFGIFSWSEVGFAYFSVSLLCLLIFPQYAGYLAACNLCCLPFSFWSVWYQKTRAGSWCTLCLIVQATLWLLFTVYLLSGCFSLIFPLRIEAAVLIVAYAVVLLLTNRIDSKYSESFTD